MPFIAETYPACVWNIQLNTSSICDELEEMLEKQYTGEVGEGSKFWMYVIQIENELNRCDSMPNFWQWFYDEYNNVEMWNEIQDLFVEEEICPKCGDEWTSATRCDCPEEDPCLIAGSS